MKTNKPTSRRYKSVPELLQGDGISRQVQHEYAKLANGKGFNLAIEGMTIRSVREMEPGYLLGNCEILGGDFHCLFVKVTTRGGKQKSAHPGVPEAVLTQFRCLDNVSFRTVKIPNLRGRWVLVIQPYAV